MVTCKHESNGEQRMQRRRDMSWVLAGPQTNCSKYVTNNYVMLIPGQRTNGFDDLNMWFCAGVKETGDTQGEGTKPRMRIGTDPL